MEANYSGYFEDWEVAIAKKLSCKFLAQYSWIRSHGLDDLIQVCLIKWDRARHTYRQEKAASRQTYMAQVVRNRLQDILDAELAERRTIDRVATSLEQPVSEEGLAPKDTIPAPGSVERYVSRKYDLEQAMDGLTAYQRRLCFLRQQGYNVTEIAALVHKARPTIYDDLEQINKTFTDAGLREYI